MSGPRFHFISGLPRAGSTLLAALLGQNPGVHASISSPLAGLAAGVLAQVAAGSEFAPLVDVGTRRRLLRGLFDSYYAGLDGLEVIFDTNRQWCARLPMLLDLFPEAKVIACVRNVAWVMDSLERVHQANPYEHSRLFGPSGARGNVYMRLEQLAQHDQMVGSAWAGLREAFYGPHAAKLLVVDYDLLAQAPGKVMPLIYRFIGAPEFTHDFENAAFDAPEFDAVLGAPGLHRTRAKVAFQARRTVLPPDLFEKYTNMSFWTDPAGSAANVIAPAGSK